MNRSTIARAAVLTLATLSATVLYGAPPAHAAVSASFTNGILTIIGDAQDNVIRIAPTAGGTISVNEGSVPIAGGPASVAATTRMNVFPLAGNDVVSLIETAGDLPASLIVLGSGDDVGTGGSGVDSIFGEGGTDVVDGGPGQDTVDGGQDRDFLRGGEGNDVVQGGDGDDELRRFFRDDDDDLVGGAGIDVAIVEGSPTSDIMFVGTGPRAGTVSVDDLTNGGTVVGDAERVDISGGSGSDTMLSTPGLVAGPRLRFLGGFGTDVIDGSQGDDEIFGGDDRDFLRGGGGLDVIRGGSGDDELDGGSGPDSVLGESGADLVTWSGGGGDDAVDGGPDADVLRLDTGAAPDTAGVVAAAGGRVEVRSAGLFSVRATIEQVVLRGGGANDNLSVGAGLGSLTGVRLEGGLGDDRLNGNAGRDELAGEGGNDLLFGEDGDDTLDGGTGNDQLVGHRGHDLESGGDGDDVLHGNQGDDNLDAGAGFDFVRGGPGFDVAFDGEDVLGVP